MPRGPTVIPSVITKAIKNQKHAFKNGIPVPSNSCWMEISKSLNHQITPKSLYMIVKKNTYGVQKVFKEKSQIVIDNIAPHEESSIEDNINDNTIYFNITLSVEEWKQIGPTAKIYTRKGTKCQKRNYDIIELFNWTATIQPHFCEQTGISCGIYFKRCKVHLEGRVFISIFGSCPLCKSEFTGEIKKEPTKGSKVLIKCKYQGMYRACKGEVKRRFIVRKQHELKNKLNKENMSAILKNGNRPNFKSIRIGGICYTSLNTCAFDSIFHILCTSYCDSTLYAEYINANRNNLIFMMVSNAIKNGINAQTYRKRMMILKDICELEELSEKLINIHGDNSLEVMTRKILENMPSRIYAQNCTNCPNQQISEQPIFLNVNDIKNINKLLLVNGNVNKCFQCDRRLINPYRYGEHIFLMITPSIDFSKIPRKEISNNLPLMSNSEAYSSGVQLKLQDIPTHITIKRHVYNIRGAINFIKPSNVGEGCIGHYVSYCFREGTNQWELYDDLKNNPIKCKANTTINAEMIIYSI